MTLQLQTRSPASQQKQSPRPVSSRRDPPDPLPIATRPTTTAGNSASPELKMQVSGLRAGFGRSEILKGLSFPIVKNQVTSIIGPSGCGKSTLIRCLNRMHEVVPSAYATGQVLLDGFDILDRRVDPVLVRRKVGMVFQKPNPFPTMSIHDNVLAGLRLNGLSVKHAGELVEKRLREVALWDEVKDGLGRSGMSLSGGQQQRLCIARALAMEPEVLLMDEPCSALDPIATARVEELIHELRRDYTIAIVTHNMQQAARVADTTAFLYMGELIEFGDTDTLFTRPRERRTEEYITGRFG
jgi:phosphate transport system ATP-binding protein